MCMYAGYISFTVSVKVKPLILEKKNHIILLTKLREGAFSQVGVILSTQGDLPSCNAMGQVDPPLSGKQTPSRRQTDPQMRSTDGSYAFYWNACLSKNKLHDLMFYI